MLKERLAVTRTVTTGLTDLERQIDDAFGRIAKLQVEVIEGRRSANLPLDAGQDGLDKLANAHLLLLEVRARVNEAHYAFRETRQQMRLPVVSYGDFGDTPDSFAPKGSEDRPELRIVAAA